MNRELATGRLTGLDALRGIAAMIVALSHFNAIVLGGSYIPAAGLSVDFFFMLSGFIMARTYDERMPKAVTFLRLRFGRLWPAFALGTVLGAAVLDHPLTFLPIALLFLPVPGTPFPFNSPTWSLFCELIANFVHAYLLSSSRRVVCILLAIVPAWAVMTFDGLAPLDTWANIPEALLRVGFAYLVGVLLWRYPINWKLPPWVGVVAFLPGLLLPNWCSPLIIALAFPTAILSARHWDAGQVGLWAGRLSYPLYVVHAPVMMTPLPWPLIIVAVVIVTALATWLDGLRAMARIAASTLHDEATELSPSRAKSR